MCHHLLRIRTFASNNYVRTRWDRSRRARGRPAEIVLTAPLVYHAVAISSPYGKLLPSIDSQPSAQEDLLRIQSIGTETETSKRVTEELAKRIIEAEQALSAAKRRQMEADAAIKVAEEAAVLKGLIQASQIRSFANSSNCESSRQIRQRSERSNGSMPPKPRRSLPSPLVERNAISRTRR